MRNRNRRNIKTNRSGASTKEAATNWYSFNDIARWMRSELADNLEEYFDSSGEPRYTHLAEQAAWALDNSDTWLNDDQHMVWDLAVSILDKFDAPRETTITFATTKGTKLMRRDRRSNRIQSTPRVPTSRAKRARVQYGRLSTAAVNSVGKELQRLQRALESGEIDSAEFESRMEKLESRSRAGRRACVLHRARMAQVNKRAAVAPADITLLQNAMERLGEAQDPDAAARMLHDIVDAASEMARELGA